MIQLPLLKSHMIQLPLLKDLDSVTTPQKLHDSVTTPQRPLDSITSPQRPHDFKLPLLKNHMIQLSLLNNHLIQLSPHKPDDSVTSTKTLHWLPVKAIRINEIQIKMNTNFRYLVYFSSYSSNLSNLLSIYVHQANTCSSSDNKLFSIPVVRIKWDNCLLLQTGLCRSHYL